MWPSCSMKYAISRVHVGKVLTYISMHFYKDLILNIRVKLLVTFLKQNKKVSIKPIRWRGVWVVNLWGKRFKLPQQTHESFLTIDHSCKMFFWHLPNWTSTELWCVVLYVTYSTTHQGVPWICWSFFTGISYKEVVSYHSWPDG